jgi:pimeloyl-ACP methyl ester carboxylesterase
MNKKKLFRWLKLFALLYATVGIVVYYVQDKLLFHPTSVNPPNAASLRLNYDKDTRLNIIQYKTADSPAKGVVLYFTDGRGRQPLTDTFTAKGFEVWTMDYPGFGRSTGPRSESDLYAYALVFYKLARSRWQPGQIVLEGSGLGAGIAARLASIWDCQRLILEDPWYSLPAAWRPYLFLYPLDAMLHYHFPIYRYLPEVTAPVTLIRGDKRLRAFLKPGDTVQ